MGMLPENETISLIFFMTSRFVDPAKIGSRKIDVDATSFGHVESHVGVSRAIRAEHARGPLKVVGEFPVCGVIDQDGR